MQKYRSKDYYFFFQSTGVSHLWHDLCIRHYHSFNSVIFQKDGVERYYLLLQDVAHISEGYQRFYKDLDVLKKNGEKLARSCDELIALKEKISSGVSSRNLFAEFERLSGDALFAYATYDQLYSTLLYADMRPEVEEMKRLVGEMKNGYRSVMDVIYFNVDSTMTILLQKISHECGLSVAELQFLSLAEMHALLSGVTLAPRLHLGTEYVLVRDNDTYIDFTGENARQFIDDFLSDEDKITTQELRGVSVAKKVIVRGVVVKVFIDYARVMESAAQINSLPAGHILVTDMTVPEMVPAMKRSLAIVTDMGGMLSHAAITARELDVPCVVGTSHATRILNDGDLIEVDAENGVVTILTRNQAT